jgi:type III pantothenate kinase
MSINLLAINVGNTRSHFGVFVEDALEADYHLENSDLSSLGNLLKTAYAPLQHADDAAIYIASVNDKVSQPIVETAQRELGVAVQRMEDDVPIPIGRQLDPETIVGDDRLLNAAAAHDQLHQACIIVDVGTAVTVDFVDGEGTFHGGAILPGARIMLSALHERTAQLPEVAFARPQESIGHSTAQAMLDGVFHGVRGAVRELVERYAEFYGAYPKVIATGGDAALLFEGYELIEAIVPDLALRGMLVARRYALNGAEDQP